MKIFECKCGSKEIFVKENGNNKGLYCAECGKWIQWLAKEDLRLAQRQIEQSIVNPIPRNLEELKDHDKQVRADAIDEVEEKLNSTGTEITFDLPVEEILGEDIDLDDFAMLVTDAIQVYRKMVLGILKQMKGAEE